MFKYLCGLLAFLAVSINLDALPSNQNLVAYALVEPGSYDGSLIKGSSDIVYMNSEVVSSATDPTNGFFQFVLNGFGQYLIYFGGSGNGAIQLNVQQPRAEFTPSITLDSTIQTQEITRSSEQDNIVTVEYTTFKDIPSDTYTTATIDLGFILIYYQPSQF
jgi:hypothetical protein